MDEGDFLAKSLDTEPVKNLLGPVTKELGLIGQDIGNILRFYVNRNLQSIFTKWAEHRGNNPLPSNTDVGRLMPLIQQASLQSNEELQARWAVLLDNAATTPDDVLPSFGQTLSQLTAHEARFIDRLYAYVSENRRNQSNDIGTEAVLRGVYDPRLRIMSYAEAETLKKELAEAKLAIDDLLRLGILTHWEQPERIRFSERDLRSIESLSTKIQDIELESTYAFTEYGLSFVRAVSPARMQADSSTVKAP